MSDMGDQLAAVLNGHEITDENGYVAEGETASLESAPEEQTPVEETAEVESTVGSEEEGPKPSDNESESDVAVDESGSRYVPQKRFDKVYGEKKALERELEQLRQAQVPAPTQTAQSKSKSKGAIPDQTAVLEMEVLKGKLPQFDPESPSYDHDLDALAGRLYDPKTMTRFDAAREAIRIQSGIAKKVGSVQVEARTVKSQQSDQGITNRVVSRTASQPDFDSMSDSDMEKWLKANGQWN